MRIGRAARGAPLQAGSCPGARVGPGPLSGNSFSCSVSTSTRAWTRIHLGLGAMLAEPGPQRISDERLDACWPRPADFADLKSIGRSCTPAGWPSSGHPPSPPGCLPRTWCCCAGRHCALDDRPGLGSFSVWAKPLAGAVRGEREQVRCTPTTTVSGAGRCRGARPLPVSVAVGACERWRLFRLSPGAAGAVTCALPLTALSCFGGRTDSHGDSGAACTPPALISDCRGRQLCGTRSAAFFRRLCTPCCTRPAAATAPLRPAGCLNASASARPFCPRVWPPSR